MSKGKAIGWVAKAAGRYIAGKVAGEAIMNAVGFGGGDGGDGGDGGVVMSPNPHIQAPVQYTMGQKTAYVAGRGFRRH